MLEIRALGGSGEDSRNCFLVRWDDGSILLDCGVRREIAAVDVVYPLLTEEIAQNLDAVFLSHAHEDHTAALPYLYHLGYGGKVYATEETISLTPGFLRKWHDYAKTNNGIIPFDEEDISRVRFERITEAPSYLVSRGRSGHMLGSQWYLFSIVGRRILYTGDLTFEGLLMAADELSECDVLIIDCAYASKFVSQKESYEKLADIARSTLNNGGNLLLPVPANGRGIDMYLYLKKQGLNILVDAAVIRNTVDLSQKTEWIRKTDLWSDLEDIVTVIGKDIIKPEVPSVIIVPDGMMTTAKAQGYYELLRDDPSSRIVITGHSAKGTLADSIQIEEYRRDNNIFAGVEKLTIKVHPDEDDVVDLVRRTKPEKVMLFHAKEKNCVELKKKLRNMGKEVFCSVRKTIKYD